MRGASIAKWSAAGLVRGVSSASASGLLKMRLSVTWNAPLQKISSRLEVVVVGESCYYHNGDTNKAIVMYAYKEILLQSFAIGAPYILTLFH